MSLELVLFYFWFVFGAGTVEGTSLHFSEWLFALCSARELRNSLSALHSVNSSEALVWAKRIQYSLWFGFVSSALKSKMVVQTFRS